LRCGRWFVGGNGLLSVLAVRHADAEVAEIAWKPKSISVSFHGRDLFAPVAARIAAGTSNASEFKRVQRLAVDFGAADLPEVTYIDHYGNAVPGPWGAPRNDPALIPGRACVCDRILRASGRHSLNTSVLPRSLTTVRVRPIGLDCGSVIPLL
jgi:hypothetical protein